MTDIHIDFEEAVSNAAVRQDYLEQEFEFRIPNMRDIVYDPSGERGIKFLGELQNKLTGRTLIYGERVGKYLVNVPFIPEVYCQGEKSHLFVGNLAFTSEYNSEELRHVLISYGGANLRQFKEGISYLDNQKLRECWSSGDIREKTIGNILQVNSNLSSLQDLANGRFYVRGNHLQQFRKRYAQGIASLYNLGADSDSEIEKEMIETTLENMPHKKSG